MIKAVIFDYGGMVTDGGIGYDIAGRLAQVLQLDESAALKLFQSTGMICCAATCL